MSKLSDYTEEEINAVVEHFFPDDLYPRGQLDLNDADKLALMETMGGSYAVLGIRASKFGIQLGESLHLPQLRARIAAWWEQK